MSLRQIVLDTETTGIGVEEGHRIIEIGCVELIDRKLTGKHFHCYINPEREVDAAAFSIHGISNDFLKDKPIFNLIAQDFIAFINQAELIIHNAPFDLAFLNYELMLTRAGWQSVTDYCRITDTLPLARKLHIGQRNSLDALCRRYGIDNTKRDLHGALLDANLLAQVYLAMTGGQGSFFDTSNNTLPTETKEIATANSTLNRTHQLIVLKASAEELLKHQEYLETMKQRGQCLWIDD